MSHSQKYKRLAKKLGVKDGKPGDLLSRMHSLKGMPKKRKNPNSGDGLKKDSFKKHKLPKTFGGKSTKPGMGGRAKILASKGVPKAVIGAIARSKGEAPGQAGFHKKHKTGEIDFKKHKEMVCKAHHKVGCKEC